ncbi:hypothetical protein SAMN05428975_5389 [Mucilaginibacter sp. OK268]|jgi:hypothetical protein|uniref:exosortase Y-associated Wzy-like protein n=1 Tax=Mucilaginibacter sp. OK268 TaxID=1881048 RepID=UPI00088E377E|nr:hypothetical protein [Mucilaginibacter sp. OK268]SDQ00425.1 hypothetical protein SAMN05428975_5389 [Mucilaginibacter sp. OK268]
MRTNQAPLERFFILFLPWGLSFLLKGDPVLSYFIAWLGSFLIFWLTLSGWVKPIPADRSIAGQLMRPIFLVQIIFAGYMACTSIFYFMDVMGYENFVKQGYILVDHEKLLLTAQCQRYYCLGHASLVLGILIFMDYPVKKIYHVDTEKLTRLLMLFAMVSFPVSILFLKIPGLSQFYNQLNSLSFIAGTLALAFAIPLKKVGNTLVCIGFYCFNFYQSLISGFKEPIIVSVMVLGIFLYPSYKKAVTLTFIPLLLLLFVFLPTYNRVFRQNAWAGNSNASEASQLALDATLNNDVEDDDSNWSFLVNRLSEIDMFTHFVQSTPKQVNYYGFTLLKQSGTAIIPRIFWRSKPITEEMIMERVYNAGVINRFSNVSAKPAFIVDAYLSGGALGILLCLFAYGAIAQLIALQAEKLFGGYVLGTALIFSGLFQFFWRGLSFEFLVNSLFWSYITMLVIHKILTATNILQKV